MLVEFVGPPGSGKSVAARAMADRLGATLVIGQGFTSDDGASLTRWAIYRDRLTSVLVNPRLALAAARATRSRPLFGWMLNLCRRDRRLRRAAKRPGLVLLDEGPLHGLAVTLSQHQVPSRDRITGRMADPDLVIRLTLPAAEAVARAGQRDPHHRLARLPTDAARRAVDRYEEELTSVIAARQLPVLTTDPESADALTTGDLARVAATSGRSSWTS